MYDAIIIGGGACGLMCAAQAGLLGKKTLLLERNDKVGAKILISGGGRCNYTNIETTIRNFISENPEFLHSVFQQWTVEDTINFFERYGIKGKEKTLGQLFPETDKAKDIVGVFTHILYSTGQDIALNTLVRSVMKDGVGFVITAEDRRGMAQYRAKKVVVASGGLPVQKLGASDFGLRIAKQFGLDVVQTAPALVPLSITGKDADWYAALAGNTVFSRVSIGTIAFEENILFTHWGLSGPAILQISSYWRPGNEIRINLLPQFNLEEVIKAERQKGGRRLVSQLLHDYFSRKLVDAFGKFIDLDIKIASLSKADAKHITDTVHCFKVKPAGDRGYDKAEVMRGGVSTAELYGKTLEARKIPGLYFGGETVDITGWLGGYNFQWAWASGYVIAQDL